MEERDGQRSGAVLELGPRGESMRLGERLGGRPDASLQLNGCRSDREKEVNESRAFRDSQWAC